MDKNILFFSNFCCHSKELVKKISSTPLKNELLYICVDDKNIRLPPFIQVVPTIYLVKNKSILVEDKITEWIDSKNEQDTGEILAYHGNSMNSISTNFSFLDNDAETLKINSRYTLLDEHGEIDTPKTFDDNSNNSQLNKDFEKLQQMRDQEAHSKGSQRMMEVPPR